MNVVDKEIAKLQNNLHAIRKVAGWTTEELGEQIGVTKQTISNLENRKTIMTKTQYIALRTVIDYEIATNTDNATLGQVVNVLLNSDDDENDDSETKPIEKKEYVEAVKTITATAIAKDKNKKAISAGAMAAVGTTIMAMAANPLIIGLTTEWMSKIITGKKK